MAFLNYHHLRYFHAVATEGGVARAAARLHVSQPAISAQVKALEQALGERLFVRAGRRLVLTDTGRAALGYAEEIFALGAELLDAVRGGPSGRPHRLVVGVAEALPKLVAHRLLQPALAGPEPVRLVVREDRPAQLFAALALHQVDVVLADAPLPPGVEVKAFSHLLGECGVVVCARPSLARRLRRGFPRSLDGAPFLMPGEGSALRRSLDQWLEEMGVRPSVQGEFDDSALMKVFGEAGLGAFPVPAAIEADVRRRYGVEAVGRPAGIQERFYAISPERKLRHPAVLAISAAARQRLFC